MSYKRVLGCSSNSCPEVVFPIFLNTNSCFPIFYFAKFCPREGSPISILRRFSSFVLHFLCFSIWLFGLISQGFIKGFLSKTGCGPPISHTSFRLPKKFGPIFEEHLQFYYLVILSTFTGNIGRYFNIFWGYL